MALNNAVPPLCWFSTPTHRWFVHDPRLWTVFLYTGVWFGWFHAGTKRSCAQCDNLGCTNKVASLLAGLLDANVVYTTVSSSAARRRAGSPGLGWPSSRHRARSPARRAQCHRSRTTRPGRWPSRRSSKKPLVPGEKRSLRFPTVYREVILKGRRRVFHNHFTMHGGTNSPTGPFF